MGNSAIRSVIVPTMGAATAPTGPVCVTQDSMGASVTYVGAPPCFLLSLKPLHLSPFTAHPVHPLHAIPFQLVPSGHTAQAALRNASVSIRTA